jgi:predicted nucleotidyltransferase
MNLTDILRPLDLLFKRCQIRYAVIGGYAVAAWGEERATRDVDLLCSAGYSKALIDAMNDAHIRFEHRIGDYDDPISEVIRIEMGSVTDPSEVDVLIGIRNAPAGIFDRIRVINIEGLAIPVASPEDLVILKLLSGSARDLEDAKSVIQVQADRLDLNLIRQLCPEQLRQNLQRLIES